jgi:hypothetical protein
MLYIYTVSIYNIHTASIINIYIYTVLYLYIYTYIYPSYPHDVKNPRYASTIGNPSPLLKRFGISGEGSACWAAHERPTIAVPNAASIGRMSPLDLPGVLDGYGFVNLW